MRDNTDFYCCDELEFEFQGDDFNLKETIEITGFKFCPFCGKRFSMLI